MKKFIEENYEQMEKELAELVSFNSVNSDDEKPFGSQNRKVLDKALELMKDKGFETGNVDYYAGYGEIGQGDKTIGLVCHLDIVPCGDGWDSDPLTLTKKDGKLIGRGVNDDKGAAIASMYALKYLKDTNYPLKKKVRLILGCNEETGSKCIEYYVSKFGSVDMGFTPDGDFPGIYAEKGMIAGYLVGRNSKIIDIDGGEAKNIICKKVVCKVPNESFDLNKFDTFMKKNKIKYEINKEDVTTLIVYGVAAHSASPERGVNAINYLLEGLYNADFNDSFTDFVHKYFGLYYHGEKMDFESLKDEATNTSTNLGIASVVNGEVRITVDIRFPIKTHVENCKVLLDKVKDENNEFEFVNGIEPLYFEQDSPMIQAMLKAYKDVTGDKESKMIAIGGGTYAKSMKNIIAFGCSYEDEDNRIHNSNEWLSVERFKQQVEIYIEAIKNLNEV